MKILKRNNAITLISLVITIIILLILAGISISALTGSGLFEKAKLAEEKSHKAQELENTIMVDYENKINSITNDKSEEQVDGMTITPLNDVNILLKCANKENNGYENIEQIINNQQLISELTNNDNSLTYILRSKELLKKIDESNLLESKTSSIPKMTSNELPNGKVVYSSYQAGLPYYAFDKDLSTGWRPAPGEAITSSYLQYELPVEGYCYKIIVTFGYTVVDGKVFTYKFQGKNDGTDWVDISEELTHRNSETLTIYTINDIQKYKYFRFVGLSGEKMHVAGTYSVRIQELDFYYIK